MSIEGLILIGCILTIFATFAAVLAWGVHQTNSLARRTETANFGNVAGLPKRETSPPEEHLRAA